MAVEHLHDRPLLLAPFLVPLPLDRALALAAAGRHAEAVALARDMVEIARRWRMPGLLALAGDEARPLLEEVGGPTVTTALAALDGPAGPAPVPVPGGGEILSGREVEVLRLLADGASNRTVAERLVVSENTVKTHVRHLLTKLGAGSRGEAVALARRHHLL